MVVVVIVVVVIVIIMIVVLIVVVVIIVVVIVVVIVVSQYLQRFTCISVATGYNTGHMRVCFKTLLAPFERFLTCVLWYAVVYYEYLESYYLTESLIFHVYIFLSEKKTKKILNQFSQ